MKRKHFLALAHALRRMFLDPQEVRFVTAQRQAIVENLGYFARQVSPGFDQVLFEFVVTHGREMTDQERRAVGRPPANRDVRLTERISK